MAELLGALLEALGYVLEAIGISRPDKKKPQPAKDSHGKSASGKP
ncbi:MAG: hypothetical protein ABSC48_11890 [Terracidiphilus sp.]|jgi:hypothetical protein